MLTRHKKVSSTPKAAMLVQLRQGGDVSARRSGRGCRAGAMSRAMALRALEAAQSELQAAFHLAEVGKLELDLATSTVIRVNAWLQTFLGINGAPIADLASFAALAAIEDRARKQDEWSRLRQDGRTIETEYRFVRLDGTTVYARVTLSCVRWDPDGRPEIGRATVQDVSGTRRAEEGLQQSQQMLRLALGIGGVGTFRLSLGTFLLHCDQTARQMHGAPGNEDEAIPVLAVLRNLPPADRRRCMRAFLTAMRTGRAELAFDYEVRHAQRGVRTMEARSRITFDTEGRAVEAVGVAIDVTERRRVERRAEHLASHDPLTELPNRSLFRDRLGAALAERARGVALHLVDLDRFKEVNDTFGHATGDRLLLTVTTRLRALCRASDTVARLGGDEFAIVQSPCGGAEDVKALVERVIAALGASYEFDGTLVDVGATVGSVLVDMDAPDPDALLRKADMALYEAKRAGRGRGFLFSPTMEAALQDRRALEHDLRRAVAAGEMEVFYQPLVSIARNRIVGMEALVRWRHKERGLVPPDEFIPIAEGNGSIVAIGTTVLRRACLDAASWPEDVAVAVNLSATELCNPNLVQTVRDALASSGLSPRRLELEITESTILADTEATTEVLRSLKTLGVSLSIDDFGTGFSSLSYLQRFPFDKVKIDRSFIAPLGQSAESMVIVRSVIGLCEGLNIETTAEGVETEGQLAILSKIGCTEAQGFHFSRPRPGGEVLALLAEFDRARSPARAEGA